MGPVTASMFARSDLQLRWSGSIPLTWRILAVNLLAIALMAGAFFYLDSYRARLIDARLSQLEADTDFLATAITAAQVGQQSQLASRFAQSRRARVRLYAPDGARLFDSFVGAAPTYRLRDPRQQAWQRRVARGMDRAIDWIVGAPQRDNFSEPARDTAANWPELSDPSLDAGRTSSRYRVAPDLTPVFSVAARGSWRINGTAVPIRLFVTSNARDVTTRVRAERLRLAIVLAVVVLLSTLLSVYLGRTIVRPLRRLASAATRVRLGRAREVVVPRLPSRRDEIGQLARALSDMTQALRDRIDAGEHFAADVTHELKNPLASLRSALETLERVEDPALRAQLSAIAAEDVRRLDRLVTDIAEASRVGPRLSRASYEQIDVGEMLEAIITARRQRMAEPAVQIAFARPRRNSAKVWGDRGQLARVLENLLDNAVSFSPPRGLVTVSAACANDRVAIRVEDCGPGVAPSQREDIFRRFHTERPHHQAESNLHSGLGLAIARTIVEAHNGKIVARDRDDGESGACFEVQLPANLPC